jgi:hypothetical protein
VLSREPVLDFGGGVADDEEEAGGVQVVRHRPAHGAQPDDPDRGPIIAHGLIVGPAPPRR